MNEKLNEDLENKIQSIRDFLKEYLRWIREWQAAHDYNPSDTKEYNLAFKRDNEKVVRRLQEKHNLTDEDVSLFLEND